MMKSVLISIKPKWCEKIASGQKTVEVRKTRPRIETPFKVYIYCTNVKSMSLKEYVDMHLRTGGIMDDWSGKVFGEFVCDRIEEIGFSPEMHGMYICKDQSFIKQSCIPFDEMFDYLDEEYGYGWHISDLVIYDKPKELSSFIVPSKTGCVNEGKCKGCIYLDRGNGYNVEDDCNAKFCTDEYKPLRRPPQSWCYVEEVNGNG